MKKFGWILTIILSYVTCGLYTLYMWHVMVKKNNAIAEKNGEKKVTGPIIALLLGCITFGIYTIIWLYKVQAQQVAIAKATGAKIAPSDNAFVLFLLWCIVPIYNFYMLFDNYNKCVDAYEAA